MFKFQVDSDTDTTIELGLGVQLTCANRFQPFIPFELSRSALVKHGETSLNKNAMAHS